MANAPRTLRFAPALDNEINVTPMIDARYGQIVEAMDVARGAGVKVLGIP